MFPEIPFAKQYFPFDTVESSPSTTAYTSPLPSSSHNKGILISLLTASNLETSTEKTLVVDLNFSKDMH